MNKCAKKSVKSIKIGRTQSSGDRPFKIVQNALKLLQSLSGGQLLLLEGLGKHSRRTRWHNFPCVDRPTSILLRQIYRALVDNIREAWRDQRGDLGFWHGGSDWRRVRSERLRWRRHNSSRSWDSGNTLDGLRRWGLLSARSPCQHITELLIDTLLMRKKTSRLWA